MHTPKRKVDKLDVAHSIDVEDDSVVHSPEEHARLIQSVRYWEKKRKGLRVDPVDLTEEGESIGPLSFGGSRVQSFEDQLGEYCN